MDQSNGTKYPTGWGVFKNTFQPSKKESKKDFILFSEHIGNSSSIMFYISWIHNRRGEHLLSEEYMLTSNIISLISWHCIANRQRGKVIFLIENIHCSQSTLSPNFKIIKKKRFKLYYSVSSPSSIQYKHNHLLW